MSLTKEDVKQEMRNNPDPLFTFLKEIPHNWRCGRHSGFRVCDILFFITVWRPLWVLELPFFAHHYGEWLDKNAVGYVQCPFCRFFKVKATKVRKCNCYNKRKKRRGRV